MSSDATVNSINRSNDVDVLIVGAGPTGLTAACSLAMQGVKIMIVDQQAEGANTSRAAVVHARTLEVLEKINVSRRLVAKGIQATRFTIRDRDRILLPIGFKHLPTKYPYTLMVSQATTEQILVERLKELGVQIVRPRSVVSLQQYSSGVIAQLDNKDQIYAKYVIGADGMHSSVRYSAGIDFVGKTYEESFVLADVRFKPGHHLPTDEVILYFSPAGMVVVAPLPNGVHRIVATVDDAPEKVEMNFVQELLNARGPESEAVEIDDVVWGSRFRVHSRIAEKYRNGRLVLAGDAAHVHSPAGGQGMNTGIQDALILADALVKALRGSSDALDEYAVNRHRVASEVVGLASRLTRLATVSPFFRVLRNFILSTLGKSKRFQDKLAWQLSELSYRND